MAATPDHRKRLLRIAAFIFWTAGLALIVVLVARQGFDRVGEVLATAGWGFVWVPLFHLAPLWAYTWSWQMLLKKEERPGFLALTRMRWISESLNNLLPVAQIGGDVVRARLAILGGVPRESAVASVLADVTLGLITEVLFALSGVAYLLAQGNLDERVKKLLLGLSILGLLLLVFFVLQVSGLFRGLSRLPSLLTRGRKWQALAEHGAALDDAVVQIYRRRRAVLLCSAGRLAGWVLGTGEVWLAMYFLGQPVTLAGAFMLESLSQAVRSAAFVVPAGLGVQETGLIVLGNTVGIGPQSALALSLLKRVRELIFGIPGIIAWQVSEGRWLWSRRRAGQVPSSGPR